MLGDRPALSAISTPTLVLHREPVLPSAWAAYLTKHIRGATSVSLPGQDLTVFVGDDDSVVREIETFVTGARPSPHDVDRVLATVMFTDIVASTERATTMGDRAWRGTLDHYDAVVARELNRFRGRQIKTTGDGTLATFDGPARAIRAACTIRDAVRDIGLHLRTGLHTGELELRGDDVAGIAVVVGQRVSALAASGEVLTTSTVKDLVAGSGIEFEDRGDSALKGVPDKWRIYSVRA